MEKLTHFPLRAQEDALKRAFILGGFKLVDDGAAPEIETPEWSFKTFERPNGDKPEPIMLESGTYALRSELIAALLPQIKGPIPIKAFAAGRVYDKKDGSLPCHACIQAVWADATLPLRELSRFVKQLATEAFGASAEIKSCVSNNGSIAFTATVNEKTFEFARAGKATQLAQALLGVKAGSCEIWIIDVDVDAIAVAVYGFSSREDLYSPLSSNLKEYRCNKATFGHTYRSNAADILRSMGFCEFSGLKAYEDDCYKKMNMIQEAWDTNNRGVQIVEPSSVYTGLPTVLTPSLEEALGENWKAGVEECLLFEFGHIFLPGRNGNAPVEKIALSFGGYGPALDKIAWRKIVDEFLTRLGISNHFFIPLPAGKAPAYDPADSWLIMDQNMRYLESNFGGINDIALANHGIETKAFMAQIEFAPIERKAAEEFDFVLPDYQ